MNNSPATGASAADIEIAARISKTLTVQGIDKTSLAQQIGVSYTTLRRCLEQHRGDNRSLTFRELARIADVLGVPPSTLLPASLTESKDAA